MGILSSIGKGVKGMVNFRKWMAWSEVKESARNIRSYTDVMTPQEAEHQETFEEAKKRLKLTDEDIKKRSKNFRNFAFIYLGFALLLFLYTLYLFSESHFRAAFLGLVVMFVAVSFAFREHFFYYQMKQKKLGASIKEYAAWLFSGGRK